MKTDAKMKFYTGINSTVLFNTIFRLIQTFLSDLIIGRDPSIQKALAKSGIGDVIPLRN